MTGSHESNRRPARATKPSRDAEPAVAPHPETAPHPARGFAMRIGILVLVLAVLGAFVFGAGRVSGNGMYPSVRDGDFCVYYKLESYHVGDVVRYRGADGQTHLGRIIVASGTFDIGEGNVPMLNGALLSENVVYETPAGAYPLPVDIAQGQFWIMNDFRSDTADSRDMGPVEEKDIDGKVMFLFRRRSF